MMFLIQNAWRRRWIFVWRQMVTGVITVILISPLVLFTIPTQVDRLHASFLPIELIPFLRVSKEIILFHLMGNQILGWPWPDIPSWLVALPAVIVIAAALLKKRTLSSGPVLLLITWLAYYLISRTGIYFFLGSRHSLLLSHLIFLSMAGGVMMISRWNRVVGLSLGLSLVAISILAPLEPEEGVRSAVEYWLGQRQDGEVTYVYYGAVSATKYQLDRLERENRSPFSLQLSQCPVIFGCGTDDLIFGQWLRHLPTPEKQEAMLEEIGFTPHRLWFVFSHVFQNEEELIVDAFMTDYEVVDNYETTGASVYLLQQR